jgi:hypothetical protein
MKLLIIKFSPLPIELCHYLKIILNSMMFIKQREETRFTCNV